MRRLSDQLTSKRLGAVKITTGLSWRKLAVAWGYPPSFGATLSRVYNRGTVSLATENEIRKHLNIEPLPTTDPPPCPTCGKPHIVPDCHGIEGTPVILTPGHAIKPLPKPRSRKRKAYWRPSIPAHLRPALESKINALIEEAKNNDSTNQ